MCVVEAAQGLEERWQQVVLVAAGGAGDASGDEGCGVLQRPDIADHPFGHPQGQVFEVFAGRDQEDGEVVEAPAGVAQYRGAARLVAVCGGPGKVPVDHGGGQARLGAQHCLGVAGRGGPAHIEAPHLELAADGAQLLGGGAFAERELAQREQNRPVGHSGPLLYACR